MGRRIVIGLGTGRCGTLSLANLLNNQRGACVMHEGTALDAEPGAWRRRGWMHLSWEPSEACRFESVAREIESQPGRIVGDVGFYYLPYVEMLIDRFPDIRFVCLKRDRAQTVCSYMAKTGRRNPWSNEAHRGEHTAGDWWRCYPQYARPKEGALNRYYTHYYRRASELRRRYPGRFRIWRVDSALNTLAGQVDVLRFAGVRKQRAMVFDVGLQVNRLVSRRRRDA